MDALGLNPDGYFSDEQKTNYDAGFGDCRPATNPAPTYGDGVVTPHASFLAMMHEPGEAFANLAKLQADFDSYGRGGFFDAVAVRSGTVARRYLSLDQAMIMGAVGNVLGQRRDPSGFSSPAVEQADCARSSASRSSAPARWPDRPTTTSWPPDRTHRAATGPLTDERQHPCAPSSPPPRTASPTATSTATAGWIPTRTHG